MLDDNIQELILVLVIPPFLLDQPSTHILA